MFNHNKSISLEALRNSKTAIINHFLVVILNLNSLTFVSETQPSKDSKGSFDIIGTVCHSELPTFIQLLLEFIGDPSNTVNGTFKHVSISGPNFNMTNAHFKDNFVFLDSDNVLILACVLNDNLWRQYMTTPRLQLSVAEISHKISQKNQEERDTLCQDISKKSVSIIDSLQRFQCDMQVIDLILSNSSVFISHTMLKVHFE